MTTTGDSEIFNGDCGQLHYFPLKYFEKLRSKYHKLIFCCIKDFLSVSRSLFMKLDIRRFKKDSILVFHRWNIQFWHQHSQSSFGRKIHFTFQPAAVIIESDLNRSFRSELQVLPIQPPSAMHAKHNLIWWVAEFELLKVSNDNSFVLAFPISSGDHGET